MYIPNDDTQSYLFSRLRLYTQLDVLPNQNSIKVPKNCFKIFGSIVINTPMSPPSLNKDKDKNVVYYRIPSRDVCEELKICNQHSSMLNNSTSSSTTNNGEANTKFHYHCAHYSTQLDSSRQNMDQSAPSNSKSLRLNLDQSASSNSKFSRAICETGLQQLSESEYCCTNRTTHDCSDISKCKNIKRKQTKYHTKQMFINQRIILKNFKV